MFAKTIRIIFGSFLSLFGGLGIFFGVIAIIDPVGSKMANDNDPFGVPLTLFYVMILIFGLNLISNFKWMRTKFSNDKLK